MTMKISIKSLSKKFNISIECLGEIDLQFKPLLNFIQLERQSIDYLITALKPSDSWVGYKPPKDLTPKLQLFNKLQALLVFWCNIKCDKEQTKIKNEQILFIENLCLKNRQIVYIFFALIGFYDNSTKILKKNYPNLSAEQIKEILCVYISTKQLSSVEFFN